MQTATSLLQNIENVIQKNEERFYFWTHEVRYAYILKQIISISRGKKLTVLDIGCFPYHIGYGLEMLGHTVYGISSKHEPIQNKNIAVLNIENEKFPYKDNFFDLVLCNEVIEHLPQSPIPAIKEIYRVTKKGGNLMVTTPNFVRSINRGKVLFGLSPMYPISVYFENNGKGNNIYHRHNREYTMYELAQVIKHCSFKITEKNYFISYTPFRKREIPDSPLFKLGKWANFLLMEVVPPLRDTLFILGQK